MAPRERFREAIYSSGRSRRWPNATRHTQATNSRPGLYLFGSDGAGTGYGFLPGPAGEIQFVEVPLIGMALDAIEVRGRSLADFVGSIGAGGKP